MRDFDPTASEFIASGYTASNRPGGRLFDPASLVMGGASIVGGLLGSDAASSAADAQTAAADKSIALNEPFRQMGLSAGNRLMTLLGLPSGAGQTRDALRAQLLPQFTSGAASGAPGGYSGADLTGGTVDEAGLNAEIEKQMAAQAAQGSSDPAYGSLMKDFTPADFTAGQDPGYQFRLDQGNQALQNSAAARGGLLSGRAMKDASAYNGGQASQEYQAAFNRFQTNRTNKLNPLQSLMGAGQTANGAISSDITGAGNARAAGIVGSSNAINGAIGQGVSAYQGNALMNKLYPTPAPRISTGGMDPSMYAG